MDIKADSSIDFPDKILRQCDIVVAALHTGQSQPRREIMSRLIAAVENENVDIIAHPTGRIIGKRKAYDLDIDMLLDTAADTGTVIEINAYPARLDLSDINVRTAKNKGVRLAIGTDAHDTEHLAFMKFGVDVTRRGWLEKKNLMKTRSATDLKFKDTETFG